MKRKFILFAALIVAIVSLAFWVLRPRVAVQCVTATSGPIQEFVDERGITRLPDIYTISMPYEGRIDRIVLEERTVVTAGQTLVVINTTDLATNVAEVQAVVDRLVAEIAENDDLSIETTAELQALKFVESMASTVAAAHASVTSGNKRLSVSQSLFARTKRLFQSEARTQDDLDRADLELVESQVDYQQDVLTWEAIRSIEAATKLLPQMVREYMERKKLKRAVLEKQKSEAIARLEEAKTRQLRGNMASPIDGVVLERLVQSEQYLVAGTELIRVGNLAELEIETDLLSQDVASLLPGDRVEIYGPSVGREVGNGVAGRVKRISLAGFTKLSSLGVEQQRVRVIIEFDEGVASRLVETHQLGVGFRVRARIITDEKKDTIRVTRSALFRGANGQWQLYAVVNGRAELRDVEVGAINDRLVEIVHGVADGMVVISSPDNSLQNGQLVSPVMR